jgi:hypothetical protein
LVAYSFNKRFIEPIRVGLGIKVQTLVAPAPKRQTIRAFGKRRHARPGETLQLYSGMRTKQCQSIGVARCTGVDGILLKWSEWRSFLTFDLVETDPGRWRRVGATKPIEDLDLFARGDGFTDFDDMARFWQDNHGPATFEGALILWEPIR